MKTPFIPPLDYLESLFYDSETGIITDLETNQEIKFSLNSDGEKLVAVPDPEQPGEEKLINYSRLCLFAHGLDISEFNVQRYDRSKTNNKLENLLVLTSHEVAELTTLYHRGKRRIHGYKPPQMGNPFIHTRKRKMEAQ